MKEQVNGIPEGAGNQNINRVWHLGETQIVFFKLKGLIIQTFSSCTVNKLKFVHMQDHNFAKGKLQRLTSSAIHPWRSRGSSFLPLFWQQSDNLSTPRWFGGLHFYFVKRVCHSVSQLLERPSDRFNTKRVLGVGVSIDQHFPPPSMAEGRSISWFPPWTFWKTFLSSSNDGCLFSTSSGDSGQRQLFLCAGKKGEAHCKNYTFSMVYKFHCLSIVPSFSTAEWCIFGPLKLKQDHSRSTKIASVVLKVTAFVVFSFQTKKEVKSTNKNTDQNTNKNTDQTVLLLHVQSN